MACNWSQTFTDAFGPNSKLITAASKRNKVDIIGYQRSTTKEVIYTIWSTIWEAAIRMTGTMETPIAVLFITGRRHIMLGCDHYYKWHLELGNTAFGLEASSKRRSYIWIRNFPNSNSHKDPRLNFLFARFSHLISLCMLLGIVITWYRT